MLGSFRFMGPLAFLSAGTVLTACVPEGPATTDAGAPAQKTAAVAQPRPTAKASHDGVASDPKPRAPAEPSAPAASSASAHAAQPVLTAAWEDTFDRADLGPDWTSLSPAWKITNGRLCARGARNKGAWLQKRLPVNARIEFEAYAESPEGDLKIEAWGDGLSGATGNSYTNATSYLAILGGWKNSKHVLARLNEHGEDRLEIDVDPHSDDERMRAVAAGQAYHFKIERADGKTVQVSVNGTVYFELADREPLAGAGHEHFGFNDWDAPVCFDNLKVTPLS